MMLDTLAGNGDIKTALQNALREGRLAHSLLLCGEAGTGAGYAARCLAADFLAPDGGSAAEQVMNLTHPELIVVEGEGASGAITAERARRVRVQVSDTAMSGGGRVVLVRGAHHLNAASANILLKTLEEPPENVLFLLTAPSAAAVLETIRSRCCIYALSAPPVAESSALLKKDYPRATDADTLCEVFDGKIGLVRRILDSRAERNLYTDAESLQKAVSARDMYTAAVCLAKYEKERDKAKQLLRYYMALQLWQMRRGDAHAPAAVRAAEQTLRQLEDNNGNAKLLMSDFVLRSCGL